MRLKYILILSILLVLLSSSVVNAQEVGPAFSFSDLSLQQTTIKIYQVSEGSMVYVTTINSTSDFIYDPTSDYVMVFQPTIGSTYGSSAEGVIRFLINNPELVAIALIIILIIAAACILIFIVFRRH